MSINIEVGKRVAFGGAEFVIVKVVREDNMGNGVVYITGYDPATADHEQQKQMKTEQVQESVVDTLQKLLKKGGEGNLGFNL